MRDAADDDAQGGFRDWPDAPLRTVIVCSEGDLHYAERLLEALEGSGTTDMLAPDPLPIVTGSSIAGWQSALAEAEVLLVIVTRRRVPLGIEQALSGKVGQEASIVPIFVEAVREERGSILDVQKHIPVLRYQTLPGDLPIERWPIPEMGWKSVAIGLRDMLWLTFLDRLIRVAERRPLETSSLGAPDDPFHAVMRYEAYRNLPRHPLHAGYPFKRWAWTTDRQWPLWLVLGAVLLWILAPETPLVSSGSAIQAAGLVLSMTLSLGTLAAIRIRSLLRTDPRPGELVLDQLFEGSLHDEDTSWIRREVSSAAAIAATVGAAAALLQMIAVSHVPGAAPVLGAVAGLVAYATTLRRVPKVYRPASRPDPGSLLIRRRGFALEVRTAQVAGVPGLPVRPLEPVPSPIIEGWHLGLDLRPGLLLRGGVEGLLIFLAGLAVAQTLRALGAPPLLATACGALVVGTALTWFQIWLAPPSMFPNRIAYLRHAAKHLLSGGASLALTGLGVAFMAAIAISVALGGPRDAQRGSMIFAAVCLLLVVAHRLEAIIVNGIRSERESDRNEDFL